MDKNILKQKVPTHLAFAIMLVLSFFVAWFAVSSGQKILEGSKESSVFNLEKRMQNENSGHSFKK